MASVGALPRQSTSEPIFHPAPSRRETQAIWQAQPNGLSEPERSVRDQARVKDADRAVRISRLETERTEPESDSGAYRVNMGRAHSHVISSSEPQPPHP